MYVNWQTCNKRMPLPTTLNIAEGALRAVGLPIINPVCDGDYQVIGGNAQVIVTVVCVPQAADVWVTVNACAIDSQTSQAVCCQVHSLILNNV